MTNTGIFATKEELERLKEISQRRMPVMLVGGIDISRPTPQEVCHKLALSHGLPEIPGYYGIIDTGEFVRV